MFILDTSVYMENPDCLEDEEFADSIIVLPVWVLDELDDLKRLKQKAWYARLASRNIYKYALQGSLSKGVATKKGGMLIGESRCELPPGINPTIDNKIILLAQRLKQKSPHNDVTLISKDMNLSTKASIFGVNIQKYTKKMQYVRYNPFPGYRDISLHGSDLIDQIYRDNALDINAVVNASKCAVSALAHNECIQLSFENIYALGIYKKDLGIIKLVQKPDEKGEKIYPRNYEQAFAYALLTDPDIKIVALFGGAGSGKTLMSLLAAYEQVIGYFDKKENGKYLQTFKRIIVIRPSIGGGLPLGFFVGDIDEKIDPYTEPIYDNLNLIIQHVNCKSGDVDHLIHTGVLEVSPPHLMRGRTFRDALVIIDDAQHLTKDEVKMLVTRVDERSKIVLTGDINNNVVSQEHNGLFHIMSRFKGQDIFAYTVMNMSQERSMVTKLAAELL